MTPIIEVKNLSKKYRIGESQPYITLRDTIAGVFSNPLKSLKDGLRQDEFWALKNINFTVEPGEVVGIIGHNGAGKSTLLKILSRITPPTTGEITLRGRVGSLLEVGTGFQQELTGRENIFLNGAILGMTQAEIKKKFDEIVDFAEVEKFIDTPVKHYSSGMYMRLAFSIAAHLDPEILIVDEVLAVGDAEFQKKCLGKMDEVSKKQGKTVLIVSHNMSMLSAICHSGIVLNRGVQVDYSSINNAINTYEKTVVGSDDISSTFTGNLLNIIKINKVEINGKNNFTNTIDPLSNLSITVHGIAKKTLNRCRFTIAVENDKERIFSVTDKPTEYKISKGKFKLFLELRRLPLRPGEYYLGLGASSTENGYMYIWNNNAKKIMINEKWSDINEKKNYGVITITDYESFFLQ